MSENCLICKSPLNIPHWLPCTHKFCFMCIRRHMEKRNFCPECLKSPFSPTDLRTKEIKYNKIAKLPILVHNKEEHLKRELRKRRVDIQGGKGVLIQRYRELSINVDNERFRPIPRSMDTIVRQLNLQEKQNKQITKDIENDMQKAKKVLQKIKEDFLRKISK